MGWEKPNLRKKLWWLTVLCSPHKHPNIFKVSMHCNIGNQSQQHLPETPLRYLHLWMSMPCWTHLSGVFFFRLLIRWQGTKGNAYEITPTNLLDGIHPWKRTLHWKIIIFNRKSIFKWWTFQPVILVSGGVHIWLVLNPHLVAHLLVI